MKSFYKVILSLLVVIASFVVYFEFSASQIFAVGDWIPTGDMNIEHPNEPIVALQNGNVLIAGGVTAQGGSSGITGITELYNPTTAEWTETGDMQESVGYTVPAELQNGDVLVAGGTTNGYQNAPTADTQIYDPSTGQWSFTGNLNVARTNADTVTLNNGNVLVISGSDDDNFADDTPTTELYNPSTGQWTLSGSVNVPIFDYFGGDVVLLNNGEVLKVGYKWGGGNSTVAELYNPSTGQWTETGNLLVGRYVTKLVLLQNGNVLMIGGDQWGNVVADCEIYNPSTGQWSETGSLNYARSDAGAVVLPNGNVLVAGGADVNGNPISQSEIYDPSTGQWTVDASTSTGEPVAFLSTLPNGMVFLADGTKQTSELYSLSSEISPTPTPSPTPTATPTVTPTPAPPSVGTITVTPNPVAENTATTASSPFTYQSGTNTAVWNWGDGNHTSGTVTESNGSGSVTNSHTYTSLGSDVIVLTVTNSNGLNTTSQTVVSVIPSSGLINGNLSHTNYNGANFSNQNMTKVNGTNAEFDNVNFSSATLIQSNFSNSNLTGSNFTNADLDKANLSNSNLTNANFTGTNLTQANLSTTTLTGVTWSNTTCPDGTNSDNDSNTCVGHL